MEPASTHRDDVLVFGVVPEGVSRLDSREPDDRGPFAEAVALDLRVLTRGEVLTAVTFHKASVAARCKSDSSHDGSSIARWATR